MRRRVGQVLRNPGFFCMTLKWGLTEGLCPLFILSIATGPPAQNGHGPGIGGNEGIGVCARVGVLWNS